MCSSLDSQRKLVSALSETRSQDKTYRAKDVKILLPFPVRERRIQCGIFSFFYLGTNQDLRGTPAPCFFPLLSRLLIPSLLLLLGKVGLGDGQDEL